jgi:hypothetical protein
LVRARTDRQILLALFFLPCAPSGYILNIKMPTPEPDPDPEFSKLFDPTEPYPPEEGEADIPDPDPAEVEELT